MLVIKNNPPGVLLDPVDNWNTTLWDLSHRAFDCDADAIVYVEKNLVAIPPVHAEIDDNACLFILSRSMPRDTSNASESLEERLDHKMLHLVWVRVFRSTDTCAQLYTAAQEGLASCGFLESSTDIRLYAQYSFRKNGLDDIEKSCESLGSAIAQHIQGVLIVAEEAREADYDENSAENDTSSSPYDEIFRDINTRMFQLPKILQSLRELA